jgi:hypothetical protein
MVTHATVEFRRSGRAVCSSKSALALLLTQRVPVRFDATLFFCAARDSEPISLLLILHHLILHHLILH